MRPLAITLLLAIACGRTVVFAENGLINFPKLAAPVIVDERLARAERLREIFDFPISKAMGRDVLAVDVHAAPLAWEFSLPPEYLDSHEVSEPSLNGMLIAGE